MTSISFWTVSGSVRRLSLVPWKVTGNRGQFALSGYCTLLVLHWQLFRFCSCLLVSVSTSFRLENIHRTVIAGEVSEKIDISFQVPGSFEVFFKVKENTIVLYLDLNPLLTLCQSSPISISRCLGLK